VDTTCVLVINCGSSSLKYEVYAMPSQKSLGKGLVERIGLDEGNIEQSCEKGEYAKTLAIPDHSKALELVMEALTDSELGIIQDINQVQAVGHRVVHGGEEYSESVVIDGGVKAAIKRNIELAPLHNPANLTGIVETEKQLPNVPQVAVFDTAFHQTLPPSAYLYGIPREFYEKHKIRRYGFHGTSHRYVSAQALGLMDRQARNTNVISCHLGNGASITAIQHGKSVDTSMGFTPLEGLMMGTRSGDLDPAILLYLIERGYSHEDLNKILNKQSGLLGLSGISSDMRDIEKAADEGNVNAIETLEAYAYRIRKYIGSYAANLVKVDILVFTGGIGQHGWKMRERICKRLQNIGIVLDEEKNKVVGSEAGVISMDYSPTTICVIPTNEELQIALDTFEKVHG
jgi:acetate kinase